jgi:hypothetical protein
MKIFLIILLIYLIYRFIRNITFFAMRSRRPREEFTQEPETSVAKKTKIIDPDEGEYVDYEEISK